MVARGDQIERLFSITEMTSFMGAREDQIKRLSSITKLRDEQLYGGEKAQN